MTSCNMTWKLNHRRLEGKSRLGEISRPGTINALASVQNARGRAVCSGRLKRKRDTLLPLLAHAIAYLNEFRVPFHVGVVPLRYPQSQRQCVRGSAGQRAGTLPIRVSRSRCNSFALPHFIVPLEVSAMNEIFLESCVVIYRQFLQGLGFPKIRSVCQFRHPGRISSPHSAHRRYVA
jgi:hypothetical protein